LRQGLVALFDRSRIAIGQLTRRLQLIGKQGERVAFDYGILRSKLTVPPPFGKEAYVMETTVTGSVRSRVQPETRAVMDEIEALVET